MSSKADILNEIKKNRSEVYDMPDIDLIEGITYSDILAQFIEMSEFVGGKAIELKQDEDINQLIAQLYPEAKVIASNLSDITVATLKADLVSDPHDLKDVDLAVIKGDLGVAENAAVWVSQQDVKERALYFIAEYLVIILDKKQLVNNMHEAYSKLTFTNVFGGFISGPSKTADIEQALVVGAHGAKGVTVILV